MLIIRKSTKLKMNMNWRPFANHFAIHQILGIIDIKKAIMLIAQEKYVGAKLRKR